VDTEVVPVNNGNGSYMTPTGFPLPITGTVIGTYQWNAVYSGDANNAMVSNTGSVDEQVTVSAASPRLITIPIPAPVTLGTTPVTLQDLAVLENGYHPTGTITFTLVAPGGGTVDTETVTVNGNGIYTTPTGFTLPTSGTATGTYQWNATYSGDTNNGSASDLNNANEQVTVSAASPTLITTPSPTTATPGATLQDSATLAGGFSPTGSIAFSLYAPGVDPTVGPAAFTEPVTVSGNGTYHTTVGFVANATGTWHWVATYNGDSNNIEVFNDFLDEPVTIRQQADLAVTKTVDNATPVFGTLVTYTVTVTNHGPDAATNVIVADPLPPGLILVAAAPSQGAFNGTSGLWTVGTLANGVTAVLRFTAQTAANGPIVNNAVTRADQFDPDLSNNQATASVTVLRSAGQISKGLFLASTILDDPPADPALFARNAQFVEQVYRALLHREVDALALASWSDVLDNGGSPSQFVQTIESGPEYLLDRLFAARTPTTPVGSSDPFVLALDHALWEEQSGRLQLLSPAGTIEAISPSTDASGADEVFALAGDHSLWLHDQPGWQLLSPAGTIASLSAAPDDTVFVTASDASLWRHSTAGWAELSPPGTIRAFAADLGPTGPGAFAQAVDQSLWRFDATGGWGLLSPSGTIPEVDFSPTGSGATEVFAHTPDGALWAYVRAAGWTLLSPAGTIASVGVAAGGVAFALASDQSLWRHDATGWTLLSPGGTILTMQVSTDAFGVVAVTALAVDHSLWRYGSVGGWSLLSPGGTIRSLLAAEPGEVVVVASDGWVWSYGPAGWLPVAPQ
jgi:uncharacterized repeat protein (TIGR01451 family)